MRVFGGNMMDTGGLPSRWIKTGLSSVTLTEILLMFSDIDSKKEAESQSDALKMTEFL
jgi:hypothetical protein